MSKRLNNKELLFSFFTAAIKDAFGVYSQKKNKRIFHIISLPTQPFKEAVVELVFLHYALFYCIMIKKTSPPVFCNDLGQYIRHLAEKKNLKIGMAPFQKWKAYLKRNFQIDFQIGWNSFRHDHKNLVLYPELRYYAARGFIYWDHVRKWSRIAPYVDPNADINSRQYFDNIIGERNLS